MEKNEINQLESIVKELSKYDIETLAKQPETITNLGEISIEIFKENFQKIIICFGRSIETGILFSMPISFTGRIFNRTQNIVTLLDTLKNQLSNKNLNQAEVTLLECTSYVYQYGIISFYYEKENPNELTEVKQLRLQNKGLNNELKEIIETYKRVQTDYEKLRESFTLFQKEKENQLTQITNNLESTNKTKQQIEDTFREVTQVKNSADKQLTEFNSSAKIYSNEIETTKQDYLKFLGEAKQTDQETQSIKSTIEKVVESIDNLRIDSEKINSDLKKLLNPAIAKNLQETFKLRKNWLFYSTIFWLILSLAFTGFLAWYIYDLFSNDKFSFDIEKVLVSAIKLLPVITLLYFSLRQFTKTRSLEEEYAFRESIATSLMAYAGEIKGDPNKKDELIKETVDKLYNSPMLTNSPSKMTWRKGKIETKEILELIKELKEVIK